MAQATAPVAIPDIQKLANQIVERFKPCRVILFGSYASGMPSADSDVELPVVMADPPRWREASRIKQVVRTWISGPRFVVATGLKGKLLDRLGSSLLCLRYFVLDK